MISAAPGFADDDNSADFAVEWHCWRDALVVPDLRQLAGFGVAKHK